jgi:hypothetical protein
VHAIGPDQDISLDLPPVRETSGHGPVAVFDAGAAGTEVDGRRVELSSQQLLELGSVNQDRRLNGGPESACGFLRSGPVDVYQSACAVGAIVSRAEPAT